MIGWHVLNTDLGAFYSLLSLRLHFNEVKTISTCWRVTGANNHVVELCILSQGKLHVPHRFVRAGSQAHGVNVSGVNYDRESHLYSS